MLASNGNLAGCERNATAGPSTALIACAINSAQDDSLGWLARQELRPDGYPLITCVLSMNG
jgi:hypothetical protein